MPRSSRFYALFNRLKYNIHIAKIKKKAKSHKNNYEKFSKAMSLNAHHTYCTTLSQTWNFCDIKYAKFGIKTELNHFENSLFSLTTSQYTYNKPGKLKSLKLKSHLINRKNESQKNKAASDFPRVEALTLMSCLLSLFTIVRNFKNFVVPKMQWKTNIYLCDTEVSRALSY